MRPRKSGRRDWPPNLYCDRRGGESYYRYRNPITGRCTAFGRDRDEAMKAARLLNARVEETRVTAKAEEVAQKVLGPGDVSLADFLDRFTQHILPAKRSHRGKPLSPATLKEYGRMLDAVRAEMGTFAVRKIERRRVAEFLGSKPATTSNRYRALLSLVFKHAIAEGLCDVSPVAATLPQPEVVERERLTLEVFRAIREAAEPWFRNALDLAIQTLQRREDLVEMRFGDIRDGHLYVRQRKTSGRSDAGNVRIHVGPELKTVFDRCRDDIASPFLIHRRPQKMRREYREQRDHWTQVTKEMLTREFQRLRGELKVIQHMPMKKRPSFHEIRALGADQYRAAGWPEASIQRLLGHSTLRMTELYLDRHEERWVDAEARLLL
jgi:integrase